MSKEHDPLPLAKKVAIGTAFSGIFLGLGPTIYGVGMYLICKIIEDTEKNDENRGNRPREK